MSKPLILVAVSYCLAASAFAQAPQIQPERPARRVMLSSGSAVSLDVAWSEREDIRHTPPGRLAASAPPLAFSEIHAFDNYADHSVLVLGVSNNPFLGRDAQFLDAQIHAPIGSSSTLTSYLFYFFFPPPRSCLEGASAAFDSRAHDVDDEKSDQDSHPDFDVSFACVFAPTLADFYASQLSTSLHIHRGSGMAHWEGSLQEFYLSPMEQMDFNGMTFFVFEAQGQSPLSQGTVNHFNLPDNLLGTQVDFFWAIGAPSPFPFVRDPARKNVPLLHIAYAGLGPGPNKRPEFLSILRTISAP